MKIKRAVIPAAGLGTRLRPVTEIIPKELLPIGTKPMIHTVIEELKEFGIEEIFIIINEKKEVIRTYLEKKFDGLFFGYQESANGIPDAILKAEEFVGKENFALVMPDVVFFGENSLAQIVQKNKATEGNYFCLSGLVRISENDIEYFGYGKGLKVKVLKDKKGVFLVESFSSGKRELYMRATGRGIFSPKIFDYIKRYRVPSSDRDLYDKVIAEGEKFYCYIISGKVFDVGIEKGYLRCQEFLSRTRKK